MMSRLFCQTISSSDKILICRSPCTSFVPFVSDFNLELRKSAVSSFIFCSSSARRFSRYDRSCLPARSYSVSSLPRNSVSSRKVSFCDDNKPLYSSCNLSYSSVRLPPPCASSSFAFNSSSLLSNLSRCLS